MIACADDVPAAISTVVPWGVNLPDRINISVPSTALNEEIFMRLNEIVATSHRRHTLPTSHPHLATLLIDPVR
jgi:hypothetical protein